MSFIVINDTLGTATILLKKDNEAWTRVPRGGILLIDEKKATSFPSRKAANRAVERTLKYHKRITRHSRARDRFCVFRLQPEGLAK